MCLLNFFKHLHDLYYFASKMSWGHLNPKPHLPHNSISKLGTCKRLSNNRMCKVLYCEN